MGFVSALLMLVLCRLSLPAKGTDLCHRKCNNNIEGRVHVICPTPMHDNCCYNNSNSLIIGLVLQNCGLTEIEESFFSDDPLLRGHLDALHAIDLRGNDLGYNDTSLNAFRGMTSLSLLLMPGNYSICPGNEVQWDTVHFHQTDTDCQNQVDFCNLTKFTCPQNSYCANDGPGMLQCLCSPGYHGYKCLKKGTFPFASFYGILIAVTIVLSGLLWYTQRRHVRSKHE